MMKVLKFDSMDEEAMRLAGGEREGEKRMEEGKHEAVEAQHRPHQI